MIHSSDSTVTWHDTSIYLIYILQRLAAFSTFKSSFVFYATESKMY